MKPGKRCDRIAEQMRQVLSILILERLKDPRIGFVTITRVTVSDDLRHAKVYYSVLGNEHDRKGTAAALEHSEGFLEYSLKKALPIKIIPKLTFKFDYSVEHNIKLGALIEKIHAEDYERKDSAI